MFNITVLATLSVHLKRVCVLWWHFFICNAWGAQLCWNVLNMFKILDCYLHCTTICWCNWIFRCCIVGVNKEMFVAACQWEQCLRQNFLYYNNLTRKALGVICNRNKACCACTLLPNLRWRVTVRVCKIEAVAILSAVTSNYCKIKLVILLLLPYTPVEDWQQQQQQNINRSVAHWRRYLYAIS